MREKGKSIKTTCPLLTKSAPISCFFQPVMGYPPFISTNNGIVLEFDFSLFLEFLTCQAETFSEQFRRETIRFPPKSFIGNMQTDVSDIGFQIIETSFVRAGKWTSPFDGTNGKEILLICKKESQQGTEQLNLKI